MRTQPKTSTRPTLAVAACCAALALLVSGCGSGPKTDDQNAGAGSAAVGGHEDASQGKGGPGGSGPGGSGKVAAVSGSTAQVQNQAGQVAVSWTATTKFSQEVATTAAALKVGSCVMALPEATSTPSDGSTPDASTPVAAGSVRITAAVNGACTTGFGGPGGQRPGGPRSTTGGGEATGTPPSGAPSGAPSGRSGARRVGGFGAFGKVTAVSGTGFTVSSERPATSSGSSTQKATTTATTTVTTSSATTWTTTRAATASAVKVGQCVASIGKADGTGAITATTLTVSAPVAGECTGGFIRAERRP